MVSIQNATLGWNNLNAIKAKKPIHFQNQLDMINMHTVFNINDKNTGAILVYVTLVSWLVTFEKMSYLLRSAVPKPCFAEM